MDILVNQIIILFVCVDNKDQILKIWIGKYIKLLLWKNTITKFYNQRADSNK